MLFFDLVLLLVMIFRSFCNFLLHFLFARGLLPFFLTFSVSIKFYVVGALLIRKERCRKIWQIVSELIESELSLSGMELNVCISRSVCRKLMDLWILVGLG